VELSGISDLLFIRRFLQFDLGSRKWDGMAPMEANRWAGLPPSSPLALDAAAVVSRSPSHETAKCKQKKKKKEKPDR